MAFDVIAEVFNIFNRTNYALGTQESQPANYLQPCRGRTAGAVRLPRDILGRLLMAARGSAPARRHHAQGRAFFLSA